MKVLGFEIKKVEIPKEVAESPSFKSGFAYSVVFTCPCGKNIRLRTREPRQDGPSNFAGVYPDTYPDSRMRGHSIVPSRELNWKGLIEERGWDSDPVKCPICKGIK